MIVYLANKTLFREKPHGKGAQASCLFLEDEKATGKMPVLLCKIIFTGKLIDGAPLDTVVKLCQSA